MLAGRNGAGKSTFLKAVALTVAGPSVSFGLQQSFAGWIREGSGAAVAFDERCLAVLDKYPDIKGWL